MLCVGRCASWRRRMSFGKSQRLLRVAASKHQRFELMDAQKASYSMTLMAKILGVTRAGYYAWKNRVGQHVQHAAARQRLDEAVAWEHEVSVDTYETPRIQCALTHGGVDVGVRAVAASMRRLGLTSLHARPRPAKRGGRPLWPMRTTAPTSGTKARLTACGSRTLPTCAARTAGSTCAPCARHTRAECSDRPWASSKAPTWSSPRSTWPLPPVAASPVGSCSTLIGEHSSPPRSWPPTCTPCKEPCRWTRPTCAGIMPWPNPFGPPQNRALLPTHLHHPRPSPHRGRHLDRRLLQPPPHPHQPR